MVVVSHDDLPAQMLEITGGDYRLTAALEKYIAWLYRGAAYVLTGGQNAAKISGIQPVALPENDRMESVWDACVRARRGRENQNVTNPMEVVRV